MANNEATDQIDAVADPCLRCFVSFIVLRLMHEMGSENVVNQWRFKNWATTWQKPTEWVCA